MSDIREEIESIISSNKRSIEKKSDYSYLIDDLCKLFNEKSVSSLNRYFIVNYSISCVNRIIFGELALSITNGEYPNSFKLRKKILNEHTLGFDNPISTNIIEVTKSDYEQYRKK
jgi:hypothetical protein